MANEKKVDLDALQAENERLKTQQQASDARQEQMIDMLADLQAKIDAIPTAPVAASVARRSKVEEELDAEYKTLMADPEFRGLPNIQVLERRALHGTDANMDVRLKGDAPYEVDPRGERCFWKLRWFNFGKDGRSTEAAARGYEKVEWDDLQDAEAVATGLRTDKYVRRGDRGLEVLHKIPQKYYNHVKKREAARTAGLLTSETALRDRMANGAAHLAGQSGGNADQAGTFVAGKGFQVTIKPEDTTGVADYMTSRE
jgi:hypothetical protein